MSGHIHITNGLHPSFNCCVHTDTELHCTLSRRLSSEFGNVEFHLYWCRLIFDMIYDDIISPCKRTKQVILKLYSLQSGNFLIVCENIDYWKVVFFFVVYLIVKDNKARKSI